MSGVIDYLQKKLKIDIRYFYNGLIWTSLGSVVSAAATLTLAYCFANWVDPSTYGQYKYIVATITFLGAFSLSGAAPAITTAVARGFERTLTIGMKLQFLTSLLPLAMALVIGGYYLYQGNYQLGILIPLVGMMIPLSQTLNLHQSFLNGKKEYKYRTFTSSINTIIPATCLIITLFYTTNIFTIVTVYAVTTFSTAAVLSFITFKKYDMNDEIEPGSISMMWHTTFVRILPHLANNLDKVLFFQYLGAAQLAVYTVAQAIPNQLRIIPKNIYTLFLPKLSVKSPEMIKRTLLRDSLLLTLLALGIIIPYVLVAPMIFYHLFPNYMDAVIYSQFYSAVLLTMPLFLYKGIMQAHHLKAPLYLSNTIVPITKIGLLIICLPYFGLWAGLISIFGGILVEALFFVYWFHFKLVT